MRKIEITRKETYRGDLILVSPDHPMEYEPDENGMRPPFADRADIRTEEQTALSLRELLKNIRADRQIVPVSGFRTRREQEKIWEDSMTENGPEFTRTYVAVPGHSEHQTGLAIDLAGNEEHIDFICPKFPHTGIFYRFRCMAPRFGFTERYLAGKEAITGIGAEPWHFRYVGCPHAVIMAEKEMVLEEYLLFLKRHTDMGQPYIYTENNMETRICYIPVGEREVLELPKDQAGTWSISGTNEGGVILSIRRRI